ncbi:YcxB family protein [Streptomyces sp. NPDC002851]
MAENGSAETDDDVVAGHADGHADVHVDLDLDVDERTAVRLTYRPQPADTLVGIRVRERIKVVGLLLRFGFLGLWAAYWVFTNVNYGGIEVTSTVLFVILIVTFGGYPRLQAAHIQRIIGWQGEYRATVSPTGITCSSDHGTLFQKWSVFQGYRETAGHFVLLSRDPDMLWLDVMPKRGVREPGDVDRLRALLDQHTRRV